MTPATWGSNTQPGRRVKPAGAPWRCRCKGRPWRRGYLVACTSCGARRDEINR